MTPSRHLGFVSLGKHISYAALKIHCSGACKALLDQLGGYLLEERGLVAMKGKRDQVTWWVRGEEPGAAAARARRRAGEGAGAGGGLRGQRSSLKARSWKNQGSLHRCCSLESPKKLRFASGNHLESYTDNVLHHRSDEYLMEVVGEGGRPSLLEAPLREQASVSCPVIEAAGDVRLVVPPRDPAAVPLLHH